MRNLICVILIVLVPLTLASNTQHRFKVYVRVSGYDSRQAVNTIESHLKRELRLLGDVDVVGEDDNWEYIIYIFVMSRDWKDGTKTGWYIIGTYEAARLARFVYEDPAYYKSSQATLGGILGAAHYSKEKLSEFCINHVGKFEKYTLEPRRSLLR